jgi:hypothetical protein
MSFLNPAVAVKGHALHFQEGFFHFLTAAKTAEHSVRPDDPMTRNDRGKGVAGQRCSDRPGREINAKIEAMILGTKKVREL